MHFTPTIDAAQPLPDIGGERISAARFSCPSFMAREWTHLWRRVWNVGPRLEEFSGPGGYVVHGLGKESLLFVMDAAGTVRCFYNVCQHRGNRLVTEPICGTAQFFKCAFHAWSWNIDGSIKGVPDADTFPQFRGGLPKDELGLGEIRTAQWGGWVWFNLDGQAAPLDEFLGVLPQHLAPYRLERLRLIEYKSFLWDCNWKTACDAFNESYHFRGLHPQMLHWANDKARIELLGIHSRMINEYGTTSAPFRDAEEPAPELREWMRYFGMDANAYTGLARDARLARQRQARSIQHQLTHLPYADLSDEQLSDVYHYFVFPGFAMNVFAEGINAFRYRPHETDPNRMYYDLLMLVHWPDDRPLARCERKFFDERVDYARITDTPVSRIVTEVLQQDADNVGHVQQGLRSDGFRGAYLGDQEIRLRHFHNTVDAYLARD